MITMKLNTVVLFTVAVKRKHTSGCKTRSMQKLITSNSKESSRVSKYEGGRAFGVMKYLEHCTRCGKDPPERFQKTRKEEGLPSLSVARYGGG